MTRPWAADTMRGSGMTTIALDKNDWLIDGAPTYAGRVVHSVELARALPAYRVRGLLAIAGNLPERIDR